MLSYMLDKISLPLLWAQREANRKKNVFGDMMTRGKLIFLDYVYWYIAEISSWEIYSFLNSLVVQTVKLKEVWREGAWNVCFLHIAWVIISIVPWWLSGTWLIIGLPSHWLLAHPRERHLIIIQSTNKIASSQPN